VVTDEKSGENYHLKHLIKLHLEKVKADKNTKAETRLECEDIAINLNGMTKEEMGAVLRRFEMKAPISGNDLSEPSSVTLMFSVFIYQTGNKFGHLSPDLAQGIFVNFNRLHEFNDVNKLPHKYVTYDSAMLLTNLLNCSPKCLWQLPRQEYVSAMRSRLVRG
jgi:glycyl-tRNA synthetase